MLKKRLVLVAGVSVALFVGSGCGQARSGVTSKQVRHSGSTSPSVTAPNQPSQDLIQSIIDGLGKPGFTAVNVGSPPGDTGLPQSDQWITINVPSLAQASDLLDQWKAQLLAGDYRQESPAYGLADDDGVSIVADDKNPGGSTMVIDTPRGIAIPDRSDAEINALIQAGASSLGLKVVSTDVLRPFKAAPVVVLSTDDPVAFVKGAPSIETLFQGSLSGFEGTFVEVLDSSGSPVLINTWATRTGEGSVWIRPDLRSSGVGGDTIGGLLPQAR